ncbi:MAG: CTP synthase [archaeon]
MTKYIVVTGGVISGVGKGVASASIGKIMQEYGFNTTVVKLDAYLNVDPGTMRPTEHGEVFVTEDGAETDQDLGTYERFLGSTILKKNNIVQGAVFQDLLEKERRGDFLGRTVQLVPHVSDEIKKRVVEASKDYDISVVEVGGTIGDDEHFPFLFAMNSLGLEVGRDNLVNALVSYLPTPSHIKEMKTKPTQIAIKLLRHSGIQPDFVLCRGAEALDSVRKRKIKTYANISEDGVISMPDVTTSERNGTIYQIPLQLEGEKFGEKLLHRLELEKRKEPDWERWGELVDKIVNPEKTIRVGMICKYIASGGFTLEDAYVSVNEALKHAGANNSVGVDIQWIDANGLNGGNLESKLDRLDGIIVPGGFGGSGVEGKICAIKHARENNIPYLGLCFGLQLAVVEYARNVCGLENAHTSEINPETKHKVIDILPEQLHVDKKGASMRLGAYRALLKGRVREIYRSGEAYERHRHRYEVNPYYHDILQEKGLVFSGMSPDGNLVEFIEIPENKFFIATQAHPEFKSSLMKPAPLFDAFVRACNV